MRALGLAVVMMLTLVAGSAAADEPDAPTLEQVQEAEQAVEVATRDVAAVQTDLVLANERLRESAVAAAQAAEDWNGARYRLQQARRAAAEAEERSEIAGSAVARQQEAYAESLVTSYQTAPDLTGFGAIVQSDGIETVIDHATTMQTAEDALDDRYDEFRASATLADVATQQAQEARDEAAAAQADARAARDAARSAALAAEGEAAAITAEKDALLAELARLQGVSLELATQRQAAIEAAAAEAAAAAAQREQELAQQAQEQQAQQQAEEQEEASTPTPTPTPTPQQPSPTPEPQPEPSTPPPPPTTPTPPPPPAPSGGAPAAIAFARAQIGEPYRWGAAGPSAWDCSGLTMGAWAAGGKSLPHYSVAQYEQSTPMSIGALRPGDLLFWGSSSASSSIYHVALYVGGGQMIHAPRTGRPVVQESMYYWTTPNFFARP